MRGERTLSDTDQPQPFEVPRGSEPAYEVLSSGATAGTTVVPPGEQQPTGGRRRRTIAAVAAAALVLGIGATAVAVGTSLGGGGAQPETVVPANAVLYAEVDLDPAAAQKVAAFRFLRKFPALQDAFTADGGYGPGLARLFEGSGLDYATEVEPWLGKRLGVALVPGPTESAPPRVMVAIQATDEAKAKASLDKLVAKRPGDAVSVAVSGGYAILAGALDMVPGAAGGDVADQLVAAASAASLADSPTYRGAVEPFGDSVATFWQDSSLAKVLGPVWAGLGAGRGPIGSERTPSSAAAVLRFDGDTLEVVGRSTGPSWAGSGGVPAVTSLPDDTLVAVGGSDVGSMLRDAYGTAWEQLAGLAAGEVGADLADPGELGRPASWPTLFGDQTVLGVGASDGEPALAVHVVGGADTVAAVLRLVQTADDTLQTTRVPDGVVVGGDPSWTAAVAQGGDLGGSEVFRKVVPDSATAGLIGFVDVQGLAEEFADAVSAEDRANLTPLRAIGVTASSHDATTEFRVRVLTE